MPNRRLATQLTACVFLSALGQTAYPQFNNLSSGEPSTVPLFLSSSNPDRESFARIINHSGAGAEVTITAVDDAGTRFGPVSYTLTGNAVVAFNSADLEERLREEHGSIDPQGDWRLVLDHVGGGHGLAGPRHRGAEIQSYIRTRDGFVTSMHDVVETHVSSGWATGPFASRGGDLLVTFFNPASNTAQRSFLRLTNPYDVDLEVDITGIDDNGDSPGSDVRILVPSGASRTLSSQDLESGSEAFSGALGDGVGKWRLVLKTVGTHRDLLAMSLLESPTGHLTNLSSTESGSRYDLPLVPRSDDLGRQGFVRVTNYYDSTVTFSVLVADDDGRSYPPVEFSVAPHAVVHFNSGNLEQALGAGSSARTGNWRLTLRGAGVGARAYMRTADGFVTKIDSAYTYPTRNMTPDNPEMVRYLYVPFLNPGGNPNQRGILRLVNPHRQDTELTIVGVDDRGDHSAASIRLTLPAGQSRVFTALELEEGSDAFDGHLGDGSGKWRLFVIPRGERSHNLGVASLIASPTGHLTSLGSRGNNARHYSHVVWQPRVLKGFWLHRAITEELGKPDNLPLSWIHLEELTHLDLSAPHDCYGDTDGDGIADGDDPDTDLASCGAGTPRGQIEDLTGLQFAHRLESLNLRHNRLSDFDRFGERVRVLRHLEGLRALTHLDLGYNRVRDVSPLSSVASLTDLDLTLNWGAIIEGERVDRIQDISPLRNLYQLERLILDSNWIDDLEPLALLANLRKLSMANNRVSDVQALSTLSQLAELDLSRETAALSNWQALAECANSPPCPSPVHRLSTSNR